MVKSAERTGQRNRAAALALAVLCLVNTTGCITTLSLSEEREWGRLLEHQVVREPIPFKSKGVAGFWSFVVPGIGHFYVGEPGWGVTYLLGNLLWPLNPFWTLPAGLQAADVTNKRRTVEYYKLGAHEDVVKRLQARGKLPADFKSYEEAKGLLQGT